MLFLLLLCVLAAHAQNAPRVNITQGVIIGSQAIDGDYFTFYGIHYGGPTSGDNRFKAPTDSPAYTDDYYALNNDIKCAQPSSQGIVGTEDCLVLNIHTKNLTSSMPVLVWLEGEDYERTSNTTRYSYNELVQSGLLVVSINYRLSIFGFLCLGVPEAPGNAGLKDVVHGLKWIQSNIVAFGGDPNRVTLLGHGSGAAMVDLITMSPLASGLFNRVIVLSGSALSPWAVSYDPIGHAAKLGAKLGYTNKSPSELATLFANTNISLLSNTLNDFVFYNSAPLFAPCIENIKLDPNGTFLSDAPINILRSGNYNDVFYIAGFTNREGTMRAREAAHDNWLAKMDANFENFLTADLAFKSNADRLSESKIIRDFYFPQETINIETIEDYWLYFGDVLILVPITRGAIERARTSRYTVRLFEFAFRGTNNSDTLFPQLPVNGVKHGGLLNYLFNFDLDDDLDIRARNAIIGRVVAFAQTAIPHPPNTGSWPPIEVSYHGQLKHNMLYWNDVMLAPEIKAFQEEVISYNRNSMQTSFWARIFDEYYRPPMAVSSAQTLLTFGLLIMLTQILVFLL